MPDKPYRGRFAPSPTGPLHFGSLLAAVGSFLDARSRGGEWLVRMEDLDPPREIAGAADDILRTLDHFGLYWDGTVLYQSRRHQAYREALAELERRNLSYPCGCTRREIQSAAKPAAATPVYPGTCRNGLPKGREARSTRIRVTEAGVRFSDRLQGVFEDWLPDQVGDFIIRRGDGLFAYQLAVTVDDAEQQITDVVRGADLLDSTSRQIYLQRSLDFSTPDYLHLPLAVDREGKKLSKQTHAPAVDSAQAVSSLIAVLEFLGQALPETPQDATLDELLQWAVRHWDTDRLPRRHSIALPGDDSSA